MEQGTKGLGWEFGCGLSMSGSTSQGIQVGACALWRKDLRHRSLFNTTRELREPFDGAHVPSAIASFCDGPLSLPGL